MPFYGDQHAEWACWPVNSLSRQAITFCPEGQAILAHPASQAIQKPPEGQAIILLGDNQWLRFTVCTSRASNA